MNILFLHNNFPAQFRHLAEMLGKDPKNNIVFLSVFQHATIREIAGVRHIPARLVAKDEEVARKSLSPTYYERLRYAHGFARAMLDLRKSGFSPDIVYSHPGWGCAVYAKDIFPNAMQACYFEWYYDKNPDVAFMETQPSPNSTAFLSNKQKNMCILDALEFCDVGISPTQWQKEQHPASFGRKIHVLHDGVDTDFFVPKKGQKFAMEGCDLSKASEIITYTTRGLEPYRGFPTFYKAIAKVLERRKQCHVVIMANDRSSYGKQRADGKSWKEHLQETVPLDASRVHFISFSPYEDYLKLLQASDVHVYLTVPFVLSWSMLEAMSAGCLVVASDTAPVREVIEHGKNGFLTDFWDEERFADVIVDALKSKAKYKHLRENARQTICDGYDLKNLLQKHWDLIYGAYLQHKALVNR